jgi:SprT protein
MLWVEQLEMRFATAPEPGRDRELEERGAMLLRRAGAGRIANALRVEWSTRLRSSAGRANYRDHLITLNPRLYEFGQAEIDRTLRHELAHLLAQFRSGRRRVAAHGDEWRTACEELGISGEARCHALPLPVSRRAPRYVYRCPMCEGEFPRVRLIRRAVACLACSKKHNRGRFDPRAKLRLVRRLEAA